MFNMLSMLLAQCGIDSTGSREEDPLQWVLLEDVVDREIPFDLADKDLVW